LSDRLRSRIWSEAPDPRSPFIGRQVRLCGYDYYGEILGAADWLEVVWLLLRGDAPTAEQLDLVNDAAVMLADPGPRDPAVHAAMCGGIGGSRPAASLMAALAVAAGDAGGSGELLRAMRALAGATDRETLAAALRAEADGNGCWPGFSAASRYSAEGVLAALDRLSGSSLADRLLLLQQQQRRSEGRAGLTLLGVAAAAFCDLDLDFEQAEAMFLLFRLPGALAHAAEQRDRPHRDFPFFSLDEAAL